jgi:hypothetical protein
MQQHQNTKGMSNIHKYMQMGWLQLCEALAIR